MDIIAAKPVRLIIAIAILKKNSSISTDYIYTFNSILITASLISADLVYGLNVIAKIKFYF